MANTRRFLTEDALQALPAPNVPRVEIVDTLVPGLRIRITRKGTKTFIVRKRRGPRVLVVTIGRHSPRLTLSDARKQARTLLADIEDGKPIVRDKAAATAREHARFGELWELFLKREVRGRKRSEFEFERVGKKFLLPEFEHRLVDSLTRSEITRFTRGIEWRDPNRPTPRAALTAYQFLSSFYSWLLPMYDTIPANPCRGAGRPKLPRPRDRFLSDDEIKIFWQACEQLEWPFGPGFRLLLLTGQRRGELFGADRSEFAEDLWTIPAQRAKNGLAHLVPLSVQAKAILDALPTMDGYAKLFPVAGNPDSSVNGFSKGAPRLLRIMGEISDIEPFPHFTIHDLRRTVATGMQRLGVQLPVTEAVLNHVSGSRSGIAAVYQRHDYFAEKRAALDLWAGEVTRLVST